MANKTTCTPNSCNDVDLEKGLPNDGDEIQGLSSPTVTAVDNLSLGKTSICSAHICKALLIALGSEKSDVADASTPYIITKACTLLLPDHLEVPN
jgi:hypothetical protein